MTMNGIDKIAEKITEDARQGAEAILAEANREIDLIASKYALLAQEEEDRILALGGEQSKEIVRRAASAAEQEAKLRVLGMKQNMIARAFDACLQKLLALPENEYTALLAKLASEALSHGGAAEIILSPKDQPIGKQVLDLANGMLKQSGKQGSLALSAESREMTGGLVLKSGDVEVNCSLDTVLRLSKEELTHDVAAALFS